MSKHPQMTGQSRISARENSPTPFLGAKHAALFRLRMDFTS
jgi:hypothetical protein